MRRNLLLFGLLACILAVGILGVLKVNTIAGSPGWRVMCERRERIARKSGRQRAFTVDRISRI